MLATIEECVLHLCHLLGELLLRQVNDTELGWLILLLKSVRSGCNTMS
jgi:hypothetical protein